MHLDKRERNGGGIGMNTNEYNEVDLLNLIKALLHRWWVIIAGTIVCAAIGYVWSAWVVIPTYVSTTKIYITGKQTTRNGSYNGSTTQMLTGSLLQQKMINQQQSLGLKPLQTFYRQGPCVRISRFCSWV